MEESTIWKGSPSQWVNFKRYFACGFIAVLCLALGYFAWQLMFLIIIPIIFAFSTYMGTKSIVYEITTERLKITNGILSKRMIQVEFYRIKDITLTEPLFLRMVGLSNLTFVSSDRVEDIAPLEGIHDGLRIREELRKAIEEIRERKKVFVRDV